MKLFVISFILLLAFALSQIARSILYVRYQKLWYKEKAMHQRVNPNISNAELCEQYVMFCKRNDYKVEF